VQYLLDYAIRACSRADQLEKKEAGYYAVRVIGKAPEVVIANIESKGGVYRSRDEIED
jgi:transcription elongation factor SPT4